MLESAFPLTALSEGPGLLYSGGENTAASELRRTSRPTREPDRRPTESLNLEPQEHRARKQA